MSNDSIWVLPESPKFLEFVTDKLGAESAAMQGASILKLHQLLVSRYIRDGTPYRGLYLYHTMGVGKTCSAIAILSGVKEKKKTWVLLPASLKGNFLREYEKCGDASVRVTEQHWTKGGDGTWVPDPSHERANFADLDQDSQDEIRQTIAKAVSKNINFLSFNGVSRRGLAKLADTGNPFDDSIVCIDEVHQFTQSLAVYDPNSAKPASRILYELLYAAKNARFVLLSGTPLINIPVELAYIVNLIKGPNVEHTIRFDRPLKAPEIAAATTTLLDSPHVLTATVDASGAKIQMAPRGFVVHDRADWTVRHDPALSAKAIGMLQKSVQPFAGKLAEITAAEYEPLPTTPPGEFDRLFVSPVTGNIIKQTILMRRMRGCVSYFAARDETLYPKARTHVARLPMSDEMYKEYSVARTAERKLEEKRSEDADAPTVHRTYSRAAGNFVFPVTQGIRKWYKSAVRATLKLEQDATGKASTQADIEQAYDKLTRESLDRLKGHPLWTDDKLLEKHSPKFLAILRSLQSRPGCAFVYSNFRTLEGLGLLGHLLETRGYGRVEVVKEGAFYRLKIYGAGAKAGPRFMMPTFNTPEGSLMLAIYNGEWATLPSALRKDVYDTFGTPAPGKAGNITGDAVKVMMLSTSGSKGINLRNIRTAHIMEPHWNTTQLEQVAGRAVRMRSHIDLPPDERTVDIYVYVTVFSDHQKSLPDFKVMQNYDKGLTSDEHLLAISKRKESQLGQLTDIMRSISIDCRIHAKVHGNESLPCYVQPSAFGNEIAMAPPDVHDDVEDPAKVLTARKFTVKGRDGAPVTVVVHLNKVYLASDWATISAKSKKMPEPVGELGTTADGKQTIRWSV